MRFMLWMGHSGTQAEDGFKREKTGASGRQEAVAQSREGSYEHRHHRDKRRGWIQENMWEEKLAGFGDYLDPWSEKIDGKLR